MAKGIDWLLKTFWELNSGVDRQLKINLRNKVVFKNMFFKNFAYRKTQVVRSQKRLFDKQLYKIGTRRVFA